MFPRHPRPGCLPACLQYPGTMVSLDCSMPDSQVLSKATAKTLIAVLAPFYVSVAGAIFWVVAFWAKVAMTRLLVERQRRKW